jgi:tetratricopeptide (TPR) repeat protein
MPRLSRQAYVGLLILAAIGCSSPGSQHEDLRRSAYTVYSEALDAFKAKNYSAAEPKLTATIDGGGLNPDIYCNAVAKRALCWASAGKYNEALADLDKLGPAASNLDEVYAVRSYILRKQGKAAESRAALAKARRYNPSTQEFKD